jgi:hypothetical protein
MSKGTGQDKSAQTLFYGLLLVIGVMTMVSSLDGNAWWPLSAVTLGVMVVGATIHAHRDEEEVF